MFGYVFDLDKDQIYWLFSSSSQSIAAFIALLLTGYAFVVNIMDNLESRDETLTEVHSELKITYFNRLKWLALVGGFTIIASLAMIFVNYYSNWIRSALLVPSAIGVVLTVIMGISFIIKIVDPKRYSKKAKSLLKEEEKSIHKEGVEVSIGEFMDAFINLERLIRDTYEETEPQIIVSTSYKTPPRSLVEITMSLFRKELLYKEELDLLRELIKARNLVVHGQQTQIDATWLKMVSQSEEIIKNVQKRLQDRLTDEAAQSAMRTANALSFAKAVLETSNADPEQSNEAVKLLYEVCKSNKSNRTSAIYLARILRNQGKYNEAIDVLKTFIKSTKDKLSKGDAYYNIACYFSLWYGESENVLHKNEAISALRKAISINKETINNMIKDPDFVSINDESDFIALLDQYEIQQ